MIPFKPITETIAATARPMLAPRHFSRAKRASAPKRTPLIQREWVFVGEGAMPDVIAELWMAIKANEAVAAQPTEKKGKKGKQLELA